MESRRAATGTPLSLMLQKAEKERDTAILGRVLHDIPRIRQMSASESNVDRLFDHIVWGLQRDAFEDPVSGSALRAYQYGICDDLIAGILRKRVDDLKRQDALGNLNPFRVARFHTGEIALDKCVRIPMRWFGEHTLLVGNTGSGKSNLLVFLALQLAANGCPIWISENYKMQFRHMLPFLRKLGKQLVILGAKDWKWNLLQAPGDPRPHLTMAVDLLCRLPEMPSRARAILRQVAHALYQEFGIWDGKKCAWPTLFDLFERIRSTSGLNEPARDAILDRLGVLLVSLTPRCAAYRVAWNPTDLACHSIIFEMAGASEIVKQIILESCLFSIFQAEVERNIITGKLNLFIAFDDSQRFFNHSGGGEITGMDELAGIVRATGKALCVAVQTMRGLSPKLVPNLTLKIFGRLGCNEDYENLSADLGLNQAQRAWVKLNLKPGLFVGQAGSGDWREPFLFRPPFLHLPTDVSDRDASETLRSLDALSAVPAEEFAHWEPHCVANITDGSRIGIPRLTEVELRFLRAVIAEPGKSASFYAKAGGINGRRAAEIRKRLVKEGLFREYSLAISPRGRPAVVLEPLPAAFKVAGVNEAAL